MKKVSNLKVDKTIYNKTLKRYHKKEIEIYPDLAIFEIDKEKFKKEIPIRRRVTTLHEGKILYLKYFNFWVRAGIRADDRSDHFFPDFENPNARIFNLITDIGVTTAPSNGEMHIWEKIRTVWVWLRNNVTSNNTEYGTISTTDGWPSIDEYAAYYETHGCLVWAACFSKAHLFASILGPNRNSPMAYYVNNRTSHRRRLPANRLSCICSRVCQRTLVLSRPHMDLLCY